MPELFVITGPNGAGKSTRANYFLPETAHLPVFDGDKLFYQLLDKYYREVKVSKYAREKAGEELDFIFNQQVSLAIEIEADYAYEGHFSNEGAWSVIRRFKASNYKINLSYVSLKSVELSQQRVASRVSQGGHHVPPLSIYDNYFGNKKMVDRYLALTDNLEIIDNSQVVSEHILTLEFQKVTFLMEDALPMWLVNNMPNLVRIIESR